jgi:hypothetical protein
MMATILPIPPPQESLMNLFGNDRCNSDDTMFLTSVPEAIPPVFGWSDFPCQVYDNLSTDDILSARSYSTNSCHSSISSLPCCRTKNETRISPVLARHSPTSSVAYDLDTYQYELHDFSNQIDFSSGEMNKKPKNPKGSRRRNVTFFPDLEVRRYAVILGDHPCCAGGMAMECGWEYCEKPEILNLDLYEKLKLQNKGSKRPDSKTFRLSYTARCVRLQEATGMTGCQLLQEEFGNIQHSNDIGFSSTLPKIRSLHHTPIFSEINKSLESVIQRL